MHLTLANRKNIMPSRNMDRVFRSALFIDFDNIFIRLYQQDPEMANTFSTEPHRWIAWLEESLPLYGITDPTVKRKILVRRCYLNPKSFGKFRPYLIRGAFETVDCPALTTAGKTSADVHMVLDIVELLDHDVFYDEFIIMSADADFTPVLLKLRKSDRRTSVLAVGTSSPAYRAAGDHVIDQDAFLEEALSPSHDIHNGGEAEAASPAPVQPERFPARLKAQCEKVVQERVNASSAPVTMANLASRVRRIYPEIATDWAGYGTFKGFLEKLNLGKLQISNVIPGYVYDPSAHTAPTRVEGMKPADDLAARHPEIAKIAKQIHQLTDTPYLSPEHYAKLLSIIAGEINENGYHLFFVSKNVRDKCREEGVPVGRQQITFVLRGIAFAGHRFGMEKEDPETLCRFLYQNTLNLCDGAQLPLTDEEKKLVKEWLAP